MILVFCGYQVAPWTIDVARITGSGVVGLFGTSCNEWVLSIADLRRRGRDTVELGWHSREGRTGPVVVMPVLLFAHHRWW